MCHLELHFLFQPHSFVLMHFYSLRRSPTWTQVTWCGTSWMGFSCLSPENAVEHKWATVSLACWAMRTVTVPMKTATEADLNAFKVNAIHFFFFTSFGWLIPTLTALVSTLSKTIQNFRRSRHLVQHSSPFSTDLIPVFLRCETWGFPQLTRMQKLIFLLLMKSWQTKGTDTPRASSYSSAETSL